MKCEASIPEIMAPAGGWPHLQAALNAGADAVYLGVGDLNMRTTAPNFEAEDLPQVADRCHAAGARAFLTVNTLVYDDERDSMQSLLASASAAGIDAVIAWDPAVMQAARQQGLELHLSTQASVANSDALAYYANAFGIKRVVLARECSLEQICMMHARVPQVEIEVFAHGAMCVAVSGRCFLSAFQYGKSANRGACYQPCRREYSIHNEEEGQSFRMAAQHVMSPKDLCTLPFLQKLIRAGVAALKIEGRNRSPEYVTTCVTAYRRVRDAVLSGLDEGPLDALKEALMPGLGEVFNRGHGSGFYLGKPLDQWTRDGSEATVKKHVVGVVKNYYAKAGAMELLVQAQAPSIGDRLLVQGPTTGNVELVVDSMQINGQPVETCTQGGRVAIAISSKVRPNDRVFVLHPA